MTWNGSRTSHLSSVLVGIPTKKAEFLPILQPAHSGGPEHHAHCWVEQPGRIQDLAVVDVEGGPSFALGSCDWLYPISLLPSHTFVFFSQSPTPFPPFPVTMPSSIALSCFPFRPKLSVKVNVIRASAPSKAPRPAPLGGAHERNQGQKERQMVREKTRDTPRHNTRRETETDNEKTVQRNTQRIRDPRREG